MSPIDNGGKYPIFVDEKGMHTGFGSRNKPSLSLSFFTNKGTSSFTKISLRIRCT